MIGDVRAGVSPESLRIANRARRARDRGRCLRQREVIEQLTLDGRRERRNTYPVNVTGRGGRAASR